MAELLNNSSREPAKPYWFPSPLYRYQRVSDALDRERQLLIENRLYFESPRQFNDPFDARPHMAFSSGGKITLDWALGALKRRFPLLGRAARRHQAREMVNRINESAKLADIRAQLAAGIQENFNATTMKCFSETSDSILQWSHYANGHKGYCVGFHLPRLWPYVLRTGARGAIAISKVAYSHDYPTVDLDSEFDTDESKESMMAALLTKSEEWSYEREWRALRVDTEPGLQEFPADAIRSIAFGAEMSQVRKEQMLSLLSERTHSIDVFECSLAEGRYALALQHVTTVGRAATSS